MIPRPHRLMRAFEDLIASIESQNAGGGGAP